MSEQLLLCSYLCIIRTGPIKSLISLYFLVILPPLSIWPSVVILYFSLAQCLLWFRNWWLQHIPQRESRTSRRVSVSVSGNVELAGADPSLLPPARSGPYLLSACFIKFPGAGLGCLSSFLHSFWCPKLGFGAQLSNVCLSCPHQAGDSNATNSTELGDRIWPKSQRGKRIRSAKTEVPLDDKFY